MIKRTAGAYVKPLFAWLQPRNNMPSSLSRFGSGFGFLCGVFVCEWTLDTVRNECVARLAMKSTFFSYSINFHAHLLLLPVLYFISLLDGMANWKLPHRNAVRKMFFPVSSTEFPESSWQLIQFINEFDAFRCSHVTHRRRRSQVHVGEGKQKREKRTHHVTQCTVNMSGENSP